MDSLCSRFPETLTLGDSSIWILHRELWLGASSVFKNDKEWMIKQAHVNRFDCIFTSCFALSGTAFPPLLVSSYYVLLSIPADLCSYRGTSWAPHSEMSTRAASL